MLNFRIMKKSILAVVLLTARLPCFCWGFFAHTKINYLAVFLLPPQMMVFFKPNITFISEHATDPDKRRYVSKSEAPRHYIDIDHYGTYPYPALPRKWTEAVNKFSKDSLEAQGIVPWQVSWMLNRLTDAFREKDVSKILTTSAELGHYIADAHVPLHTNSNHNGQLSHQEGIHGFWESRIPELLAEKSFDFLIGKAAYLSDPSNYIWQRVLESAAAADSVLKMEKRLNATFPSDKKYAFELRNGLLVRQYSSAYTTTYNHLLNDMVERRMRQSIQSVASFWYTAWVNAGQPDLSGLAQQHLSGATQKTIDSLNAQTKAGSRIIGREE